LNRRGIRQCQVKSTGVDSCRTTDCKTTRHLRQSVSGTLKLTSFVQTTRAESRFSARQIITARRKPEANLLAELGFAIHRKSRLALAAGRRKKNDGNRTNTRAPEASCLRQRFEAIVAREAKAQRDAAIEWIHTFFTIIVARLFTLATHLHLS